MHLGRGWVAAAACAAAALMLSACSSASPAETTSSGSPSSAVPSSSAPSQNPTPEPTSSPDGATAAEASDVPDDGTFPDTPISTELPTGPVPGDPDTDPGDGQPDAAPPPSGAGDEPVAPAPPPVVGVAAAPPAGAVQLVFTGEVLMHKPLIDTAQRSGGGRTYDFRPMFTDIKRIISSADLAVCHLELPYIPDGEGMNPRYAAPKQVADALKYAGFDRCSTASNHMNDRGTKGINATIASFRRTGMTQAGIAASATGQRPTVLNVGGIKITHLSYSRVPGKALPSNQPWRLAMAVKPRILADVRAARAAGAQYVIVSMHDSDELAYRPTSGQKSWDQWLVNTAGVDLVVGTGSHVPEAAQGSGGKYILYGLGNLINWRVNARDSVIARVYIKRGADGKVRAVRAPELIPTLTVEKLGYKVIDARTYAQNTRDPDVRAQLRASYQRVAPYIAGSIPTD